MGSTESALEKERTTVVTPGSGFTMRSTPRIHGIEAAARRLEGNDRLRLVAAARGRRRSHRARRVMVYANHTEPYSIYVDHLVYRIRRANSRSASF